MSNPSSRIFYFSTFRNWIFVSNSSVGNISLYLGTQETLKTFVPVARSPHRNRVQGPLPPANFGEQPSNFSKQGTHSFTLSLLSALKFRQFTISFTYLPSVYQGLTTLWTLKGTRFASVPACKGAHGSVWMRPLSASELPEIQAPSLCHCLVPNSYLLTRCTR